MKFSGFLLVLFLAAATVMGLKKCIVFRGSTLQMATTTATNLNMKLPCKYKMVNSQCGDYKVTITPGNRYVNPSYMIDNAWISVNNTKNGKFWSGRFTNKVAAKYIMGLSNITVNQKSNTSTVTSDLFVESNTKKDVTLREINDIFSITFGPFDFTGKRHSDSKLEYRCNADNVAVEYPDQFCGSENSSLVNKRAKTKFGKTSDKDQLVILDVFNDSSIVQVNPKCETAANLMRSACWVGQNDTMQIRATEICHVILTSKGHRECVMKSECDPMDAFIACLKYVCGGFDRQSPACETVGRAIDQCRNFPDLTEPVQKATCFRDFMTQKDNPFYEKDRN